MAEQWLYYYGMDGQSNADYQDGLHMPTGPTPGGNAAPGWAGVYTWTFQPSSTGPTWTESRPPQPSTSFQPSSTGPTWTESQPPQPSTSYEPLSTGPTWTESSPPPPYKPPSTSWLLRNRTYQEQQFPPLEPMQYLYTESEGIKGGKGVSSTIKREIDNNPVVTDLLPAPPNRDLWRKNRELTDSNKDMKDQLAMAECRRAMGLGELRVHHQSPCDGPSLSPTTPRGSSAPSTPSPDYSRAIRFP
eukprot:superscaffoldBa00003375_g16786